LSGWGDAGGFGILRLRDCNVRNRSAQDDRFVDEWKRAILYRLEV